MNVKVNAQAFLQAAHFYTDFIKVVKLEYLATICTIVLGAGPKAARNTETRAHAWLETGLSDQLIFQTATADYASRFWVQQSTKK